MSTPRRGFLRSLAVAPLLPLVAPRGFAAPQAAPAPSPAPSPPGPVAEALAEAVRQRYGSHLDAEDLEAIGKAIQGKLERAERLRKRMKLGNADEPVTVFSARPPLPLRPARSTKG